MSSVRSMAILAVVAAAFLVMAIQSHDMDLEKCEREGWSYIKWLDEEEGRRINKEQLADWNYFTNMTKENLIKKNNISIINAVEKKKAWEELKNYKWEEFQDPKLRRMFKKYAELGEAVLPEEKYQKYKAVTTFMKTTFANATVCDYNDHKKCNLSLEPELINIFATSSDADKLKYYWLAFHEEVGAKLRDNYTTYVDLGNETAQMNDYKSKAEWWISEYESPDFEIQMERIWKDVKPLYEQLHAYVRKRLRDMHGDMIVSEKGPIPAHLLGNMWAQNWGNIAAFTLPYPDKKEVDVSHMMLKQNYTVDKMFRMAEEFFLSLNLTAMPKKFWENSVLVKPTDRKMLCHASAWDFCDGEDFRIKMCTEVNAKYIKTVHQEMGHTEYQILYKDQPVIFRGASPGFHEAIGETIALSVMSTKHLRRVGLVQNDTSDDYQTEINRLYKMALDKIASIPFGYMIDLWRYEVFRGETTSADYNCHYWKLREFLQGVEPPVPRSEEDFDVGATYHVAADTECMRYYVAGVMQFQFHRALCQLAGEYVPEDPTKKLIDCDIYRSVAAGNVLAKMLRMGSSRPWPEAMEVLTGQKEMRAYDLMEYFKPLYEWLQEENNRTGEYIGWERSLVSFCTEEQENAWDNRQANETSGSTATRQQDYSCISFEDDIASSF